MIYVVTVAEYDSWEEIMVDRKIVYAGNSCCIAFGMSKQIGTYGADLLEIEVWNDGKIVEGWYFDEEEWRRNDWV